MTVFSLKMHIQGQTKAQIVLSDSDHNEEVSWPRSVYLPDVTRDSPWLFVPSHIFYIRFQQQTFHTLKTPLKCNLPKLTILSSFSIQKMYLLSLLCMYVVCIVPLSGTTAKELPNYSAFQDYFYTYEMAVKSKTLFPGGL